jgi:glucuronoarabinoxylan endo-1,4-beta-xylanase
MKDAAKLATKYGKEVWMTEHSCDITNNEQRLPNWHEQLLFAEELNECMLAGCTGYIYWYMRAHWAFVGTGEEQYGADNVRNTLLPRAYVMSHFSKYVTGSTRVGTTTSGVTTGKTNSYFETSAYIKGDSIIVMAIDTTKTAYNLRLKLPLKVKSGVCVQSTDNKSLCKKTTLTIDEPTKEFIVEMPARSFSTYIFMVDHEETTDISTPQITRERTAATRYYDLQGRPLAYPEGLCIEKRPDGSTRKIYFDER